MRRILLLFAFGLGCAPSRPSYVPRDPDLQRQPLYFYPALPRGRVPKAAVFFLGNDIGFWAPHQELAVRLASHGYAVVGFDVKKFLDRFPDSSSMRDSALSQVIPTILERAFSELGADSVPRIIGGHSFGADLAFRIEAVAKIRGVVGVLALGPTKRDHPTVTIDDRLNLREPTEPGSFDVAEQIHNIPAGVRIALLRGSGDKERKSDPAFRRAGGDRLAYSVIPFASHSLKSLIIAGPMIEHALEKLLSGRAPPR